MVNNVESGLTTTFGLVSDLNTALEPIDFDALENLQTDFTALLERINDEDTGLS